MDTLDREQAVEPVTPDFTAARARADRYRHTPRWWERLTPEAVRFVQAVDAYDRAAVTCLSCGAEWPSHYANCEFVRGVAGPAVTA